MSNPLGITFTKIEQTCTACPSQWDAWDAAGTYYYIRYRWGYLTVSKGAVYGDDIFGATLSNNNLDGFLTTTEMLKATSCTVVGETIEIEDEDITDEEWEAWLKR